MVTVEQRNDTTFTVTVENGGKTVHQVTVPDDYYRRLTNGAISKADLVRRSFDFLLEREAKESILGSFELTVIQRYFPEYEKTIKAT